jgi:Flp pilus assembly secretin CpaC
MQLIRCQVAFALTVLLVIICPCTWGAEIAGQSKSPEPAPAEAEAATVVTPSPIIEEIIKLNNLPMTEIIKALGDDPITNRLFEVKESPTQVLVRGTASEIDYAKKTISYLDHPAGYETIRLTNITVPELMLNIAKSPAAALLSADEANNQVAINGGSAEQVSEVKRLIDYLDKPRKQIKVSVTAVSTAVTSDSARDPVWSIEKLPAAQVQSNGVWKYAFNGGTIGVVSTAEKQFIAHLLYYQNHGNLKTLTNPSVTTQSGIPVSLSMGRTFYVPSYSPATGIAAGTSAIPAAITLDILAVALPDGAILAKVKANIPEPSVTTSGSSSFPIVVVNDRKIEATAKLLDGQSMIVGGFLSTTKSKLKSGVPILKDIPIIGRMLFTSSSTTEDNQELNLAFTFSIVQSEIESPAMEMIKAEAEKRQPVGTPGVEKPSLGTAREPRPMISGAETPLAKPAFAKGDRVIVTASSADNGKHGKVVEIRNVETTLPGGTTTTYTEFQVDLDDKTTQWFAPEGLQFEEVRQETTEPSSATPAATTSGSTTAAPATK